MTGVYIALGIIALLIVGGVLYFLCSPMPVVRLIRRGDRFPVTYPAGYDAVKARVEIRRDLIYPSRYPKNRYDLYVPRAQGTYPLILWVHGGSFVAGDKESMENWGVMLAGNGYAAALINYERAPEQPYPAQLVQITEAFQAIAAYAAEHGNIDMGRVVIAGDSAGAHMASQFALLHTNANFAQRLGIRSPLAPDALKCALLYCGPFDLQRMLNADSRLLRFFVGRIGWCYLGSRRWRRSPLLDTLSTAEWITRDYVPSYITDGNTGSFERHGRDLAAALKKAGVAVRERYFDKEKYGAVGHGYEVQLETEPAALCLKDTLEFLKEHLNEKTSTGEESQL